MQNNLGSARSSTIIHQLHSILKPFILRRLKGDVETNLPPKKEYVLYAPLSVRQRQLYDAILDKSVRDLLLKNKVTPPSKSLQPGVDVNAPRKLRKKKHSKGMYDVDGDDDEYFDKLEEGEEPAKHSKADSQVDGRQYQHIAACQSPVFPPASFGLMLMVV
jgi:ATP-dependent DNA helicase